MKVNKVRAEIDLDISPEDGDEVHISNAMMFACEQVNIWGATFRISEEAVQSVGDRFDNHPDRHVVHEWLASVKAPKIAIDVVRFLSLHTLAEWTALPKRTMKAHQNLFDEIERTANRLAHLMAETGSDYYRGGGHGLANARVSELLTIEEEREIIKPLEDAAELSCDPYYGTPNPRSSFPTVEVLLERIAKSAKRLSTEGPIHSQPKKRGARTGYFIRRLNQYLTSAFPGVPPTVLAALASIVLNEAIDDDLAKKALKLSERSKRK